MKTILVIEDDLDIQDIYKEMITGIFSDVVIESAYNGKEGLEAVHKKTPDLIFLDLLMPVMDGEAFLEAFRSEEALKKVPVVVCSVNQPLANKLYRDKKADAALPKIFPIKELAKVIEKFLDIHPKGELPESPSY